MTSNNSKDKNLADQNEEEDEEKSEKLDDQSKKETKSEELLETKPQAQSEQIPLTRFQAKDEYTRFIFPMNPTESHNLKETVSDDTDEYVKNSGPSEPYTVEPESQTERGPTEIFDVDESFRRNIKQTIIYKLHGKPDFLNTEPKIRIISRPRIEDLEGLRGPTEPLSTEPKLQQVSIKHTRVLAGKEGVGLTEPLSVEPRIQLEEAKRQKIYDVRVVYEEIEIKPEKELKYHQSLPESEIGPTEASNTEPCGVNRNLKERVYSQSASTGPTEVGNVEPQLQARATKQARLYKFGIVPAEEEGLIEPYAVEAQVQNIRLKGKSKLSDKMDYLTRPAKDDLYRFDGVVPKIPLRSWNTKSDLTDASDNNESLLNIEQTTSYKLQLEKTERQPDFQTTKPNAKIIGRACKEDLEGLKGPTEPLTTEPKLQQVSIKHTRVLAGKTGVGLTEPLSVEPRVQSQDAKRQKIYDVRVVYEEIEMEPEKEETYPQPTPENETGPTEASTTEPRIVKCILTERVYGQTASMGPTEADNVEPVLKARAIKQARLYKIGTAAAEDGGPTEPYAVEAQVQNIRFQGGPKLSDRVEYLARPKKDVLDRFGYDRIDGTVPEKSLPSWRILPLSTKIPAGEYPYGMTMTPLNKELYLLPPSENMDLYDSYNLQKPCESYYSLYDPQLKTYFKRKGIRNHLEKEGFISESGKVVCSLKDINDYRVYSRRILAAKTQRRFHDEDLEEKRRREERVKKYRKMKDESDKEKNKRTQVQLRSYIKNAVSTINEGSMSKQTERDRKVLNAQLRHKFYYAQRAASNKERYNRIYSKHLDKKYDHDNKRQRLEKELVKRDEDRLEKLKTKKAIKRLENKTQIEDFWERKAAAQFEWLKEGYRLESKFNKQHEARVQFQKENKRRPSTLRPTDVEEIRNKIYLLSKEEEEVEQELSAKEDQSHSAYKSRDILETNRLSIGESPDEVTEKENKSESESAKISEVPSTKKEM